MVKVNRSRWVENQTSLVGISKGLIQANYKYSMKYFISRKRTRAFVGIGIVAISIGLVSKKVINFPAGGCLKGTQELTFNT